MGFRNVFGFIILLSLLTSSTEAGVCKRIARYGALAVTGAVGLSTLGAGGLGLAIYASADSNRASLPGPQNAPKLKVAMIGDSLSRNFECNGKWGCFWQGHTQFSGGAFLDANHSQEPQSFIEHLSKTHHVTAVNNASPGAFLLNYDFNWKNQLMLKAINTKSAPLQMQSLFKNDSDTNLILFWLGHNDAAVISRGLILDTEERTKVIREQLTLLSHRQAIVYLNALATTTVQKRAIVFYQPLSTEALVETLKLTRDLKNEETSRFPHRHEFADFFPNPDDASAVEKYRFVLEAQFQGIREAVAKAQQLPAVRSGLLRIEVSDVFNSSLPLDPLFLSARDGGHPSPKGQSLIGEKLYLGAQAAVKWLSTPTDANSDLSSSQH